MFSGCVLALAASAGCVSIRKYDACVAEGTKAQNALVEVQRTDAVKMAELERAIAQVQAELQERDTHVSELSTTDHNLQARMDEATAINAQLRDELERLGKDVDKMLAERGTLSVALQDAKARLDELRRAQAMAEARAELFRDFTSRFKPLVDAGQMRIETRRGDLALEVQGDLLFDEGRSELRGAGKGALMEIAHALQTTSPPSTGRRFLVTADVDGFEAKGPRRTKPSSWDLTAARAVTVVEFLVSVGVPPASLTAAAAGSFDPIASDDDASGRAKNRRIEITLSSSSLDGAGVAPVPGVGAKPVSAGPRAQASP